MDRANLSNLWQAEPRLVIVDLPSATAPKEVRGHDSKRTHEEERYSDTCLLEIDGFLFVELHGSRSCIKHLYNLGEYLLPPGRQLAHSLHISL